MLSSSIIVADFENVADRIEVGGGRGQTGTYYVRTLSEHAQIPLAACTSSR
jgi:hypothetical protein